MSFLRCPNSVVLHFPDSVHANCGSSEVLPRLLETVDAEKVTSVQFLRGGRVRLTFKDQASCDDLISSGLVFDDAHVRVVRADLRFRSVYVRDLPFEVPDDDVKAFFESYGDVLSVSRSTFANFPAIYNGNRVVELAVDLDIPYFVTIGDFSCRAWYPGQPVHCTICREVGHRGPSCPLSGLCRRCRRPGHMARECRQPWGAIHPGTEVLSSTVPLADDDDDADYVPPSDASTGSSMEDDDEMMSGDHEIVASAAPPPSSPPDAHVPVPDVPPAPFSASDVPPAPSVSVPDIPPALSAPAPDVPPAPSIPALDVPPVPNLPDVPPVPSVPVPDASKLPKSSAPVSSAASTLFRDKTDPVLLSALGELSRDAVTRMSSKDVADFVSRLIDEHRLSPDYRSYMTNYVLRVQRKFSSRDVKKPVKRAPARISDSEGPPARKPTRPDRVPS